jgi:hypothetical protein
MFLTGGAGWDKGGEGSESKASALEGEQHRRVNPPARTTESLAAGFGAREKIAQARLQPHVAAASSTAADIGVAKWIGRVSRRVIVYPVATRCSEARHTTMPKGNFKRL